MRPENIRKTIPLFLILSILFFVGLTTFSQSVEADKVARADSIINAYLEKTGVAGRNLDYLKLDYEVSWRHSNGGNSTVHYKYDLKKDFKKMFVLKENLPQSVYFKQIKIWSDNRFYDFEENGISGLLKDKIYDLSEKGSAARNDDLQNLYWEVFQRVFPITFDMSLYKYQFAYLGTIENPDKTRTDVVQSSDAESDMIRCYFERSTSLLSACEFINSKTNKTVKWNFGEYKDFSGIQVASLVLSNDERKFQYRLKNFQANDQSNEKIFEIPHSSK